MISLEFKKKISSYSATIGIGALVNPDIELDTGSPITIISIPVLLKITNERLDEFRKKVSLFLANHTPLEFGAYGSQDNDIRRKFIPYIVNNIKISDCIIPYFMFWVDITKYKNDDIKFTSILFGFDYISQGNKFFDNDDNFHIEFNRICLDTQKIGYALSNTSKGICKIEEFEN